MKCGQSIPNPKILSHVHAANVTKVSLNASHQKMTWIQVLYHSAYRISQVEEMLIARACPIMCIYRKHGGQRGYKGHVINFPQNVQGFLNTLPCNVTELPILVVRRHGAENTHKDFQVSRDCILAALQWLKQNSPCYSDITIDLGLIANLPIDGIPTHLNPHYSTTSCLYNNCQPPSPINSESKSFSFAHDHMWHSRNWKIVLNQRHSSSSRSGLHPHWHNWDG